MCDNLLMGLSEFCNDSRNRHLLEINNHFEEKNISIRVDENDSSNYSAALCRVEIDDVVFYSLSNNIIPISKSVLSHTEHLELLKSHNFEEGVFDKEDSLLFISKTYYFKIDKNINLKKSAPHQLNSGLLSLEAFNKLVEIA